MCAIERARVSKRTSASTAAANARRMNARNSIALAVPQFTFAVGILNDGPSSSSQPSRSEMSFDKPVRIIDLKLLEQVRKLPCLACASYKPNDALESIHDGTARSHAHHVRTRGAGGDDVPENLLPLCHEHHMEIHRIGNSGMRKRYKVIDAWFDVGGMKRRPQ